MSPYARLEAWSREHQREILIGILVLAVLVRLAPITWGLPINAYANYYHPDERKIVSAAQHFPQDIVQRMDMRYGTFYHYFVGVVTLPVRLIAGAMGHDISGSNGFLAHFVMARILTVLIGAGCSYLCFVLGRRLDGRLSGLMAALLIAITQIHVMHSAIATVDVATSFLATLCVILACRYMEKPSLARLLWMSACGGALIGTKYPGAALMPTIFFAHLFTLDRTSPTRRTWVRFIGSGTLILLLIAATYLLTNPTVVLRPQLLKTAIVEEITGAATDGRDLMSWAGLAEAFSVRIWWDTWGNMGYRALSLPLAFAALVGMLNAIIRLNRPRSLLLVFVLGYAMVMGRELDGRYTIMISPALAIFAASAILWLIRHYDKPGLIVATGICVWALAFTGMGIASTWLPDSRTRATEYLEAEIPAGSRIGVQGAGHDRRGTWLWPKLSRERYVILDLTDDVDYVILNGRDIAKMDDAFGRPETLEPGEQAAIDFWSPDPVPSRAASDLYAELLDNEVSERYRLLQAFRVEPLTYMAFAPPDILIYEAIVKPAKVSAPPEALPVDAHFGDVAVLEAIHIEPSAHPGDQIPVDLYWKGLDMVDEDYTVSVQILSADWSKIGQSDQQPAAGWRPTSRWMRQERVLDSHNLTIAPDAAPGSYRVEVIVYDTLTHKRTSVARDGEPVGNSTTAATVEIVTE